MNLCLLVGEAITCLNAGEWFTFNIVDIVTIIIWAYQGWKLVRRVEIQIQIQFKQ